MNCTINNPVTIANAFNAYFSSVAEKIIKESSKNSHISNENPLSHLHHKFKQPTVPLRFKYTTTHEINSIIHTLKTKNSYGYDEVSSRLLKISAPYIISPLTFIFNKVLSTGVFPEGLKFSEVKPLFKNGSKTEFSNYRPIALLPVF